ncbi:hypothetical protein JTB14_010039 [Gonioctena quinquepunctata]|nr:hypothetical protein JTB14_010039 [Gonioctena quinquepunctata]
MKKYTHFDKSVVITFNKHQIILKQCAQQKRIFEVFVSVVEKLNWRNGASTKCFCRRKPYPSTLSKNRAVELSASETSATDKQNHVEPQPTTKSCPSLQQSSSQFFYFLRLMQLFPETHPATLHTVLCLCKNDFFCAVDKLLYARRCKALYSRSQNVYRRYPHNRAHPYCNYTEHCKNMKREKVDSKLQQDRSKITDAGTMAAPHSEDEIGREALLDLTMKNENTEEYSEIEISKASVDISKNEIVQSHSGIVYTGPASATENICENRENCSVINPLG